MTEPTVLHYPSQVVMHASGALPVVNIKELSANHTGFRCLILIPLNVATRGWRAVDGTLGSSQPLSSDGAGTRSISSISLAFIVQRENPVFTALLAKLRHTFLHRFTAQVSLGV